MKNSEHGINTSQVEVTNIDQFGLCLLIRDREYFLPYEDYPWFRNASVDQIFHVELLSGEHLHWPDLDVDLSLEILDAAESFPLIYKLSLNKADPRDRNNRTSQAVENLRF